VGAKELIATPPSHVRSHHLHTQSCEGKRGGRKQITYTHTHILCFSLSLEEIGLGCPATGYAGTVRTVGNSTAGRKKLFQMNLHL